MSSTSSATTENPLQTFILQIPKVELHLHLEGSITPERWAKIAARNHLEVEANFLKQWQGRTAYESFMDFLQTYAYVLSAFRQPEDFFDMTSDLLLALARQNVRYCEVMFTPWFFVRQGVDFAEMMNAIDRGAKNVENRFPVEMKLIFDGPRNFGVDVVREVFEMAIKDTTGRVIGVGLGGDEINFPAPMFVDPFNFARANGLQTIAHAGETAGEASMIETIEHLQVSRIGHCLGIQSHSKLENLILEKEITLELCPWSNVATNVISDIQEHPFAEYLERGFNCTLNSDDPSFFGTNLVKEYETMAKLHQLSKKSIVDLTMNAVKGSFLSLGKKSQLLKEITLFDA